MVNGWKVTAIIFIILFILETSLLVWAWNSGSQSIQNENECVYDVCELGNAVPNYDTYSYDDYTGMCSCYLNHEVVKTKILE